MIAMLKRIADSEGAAITEDALALITRAAEGSARDATSLLDQAISHGAGETTADQVRAMLGLADRGRVMDLFELIMTGNAAGALSELGAQYADGADPMAVLRDIAEITHWVSVIRITPEAADDPTVSPDERARGQALADKLPMPVLTRMWQMALKSLDEVGSAPNSMMAAEMAVIRMTHVADLPTPGDLVAKLKDTPPPAAPAPGSAPSARGTGAEAVAARATEMRNAPPSGGPQAAIATEPDALTRFPTFNHVVDLIRANRDMKLCVEVEDTLRLVSYQPGRIEFEPGPKAPRDLAQRLGQRLQTWTGVRWAVSVTADGGDPTITEVRTAETNALKSAAEENDTVSAILAAFPKGQIAELKTPEKLAAELAETALSEVEDEWDPFEED
jgi:DNA polymerase-3 subunit gamma/tau